MWGTRRLKPQRVGMALATFAIVALFVTLLPAATGDVIADHVLGQASFNSGSIFTFAVYGMSGPQGLVVDTTSTPPHLYISDTNNHRVLGYYDASTLINGQGLDFNTTPPDILIGQPDFFDNSCDDGLATPAADLLCYPKGMAVDASGNLYVADSGNSRVLVYASPFSQDKPIGLAAEYVYGQGPDGNEFTTSAGATTQSGLAGPDDVTVDSTGNVFVADTLNNRVMLFFGPTPGTTGGALAIRAWGQGANLVNFTSAVCANGGGNPAPSLTGMCVPESLWVVADPNIAHADDLYVADTYNSRTLVFQNILGEGTPISAATEVYGQPNGTSNTPAGGAAGQNGPASVRVYNIPGSGLTLFVADGGNNRLLAYNLATFSLDANSSWGTGTGIASDFTNVACNNGGRSANTLCNPAGIAFDGTNLYVADDLNNRVLSYAAAAETAGLVLGQPDFTESLSSYALPDTMLEDNGVVVDTHIDPPLLFVADTVDNRVLGFPLSASPFADDEAATVILGQNNLANLCNRGAGVPAANTLCEPEGLAVDPLNGNLWIADTQNNRVLEFAAGSLVTNASAELVLGPGGTGAVPFSFPQSVAVDSHGNLYIADTGNNRVLEFEALSGIANQVFGQQDFANVQPNRGGSSPAANTLSSPGGVSVDGADNLWIADSGNCRVLEFDEASNPPTNTTPRLVFGQGAIANPTSFTTATCDVSQGDLHSPSMAILDTHGDLFISDYFNSRVLEFDSAETGDGNATRVFGVGPTGTDFVDEGGGVGDAKLELPDQIAFDPSGNLYVADKANNRVVEFDQPVIVATPTATPTPVAGKLKVSPNTVNFGDVAMGGSKTRPVKITNAGVVKKKKTPLPILIEMESGVSNPFSVSQPCDDDDLGPKSKGVPPGTCTVMVTFKPTAATKYKGTMTIEDNVEGASEHSVKLEGVGKAAKE